MRAIKGHLCVRLQGDSVRWDACSCWGNVGQRVPGLVGLNWKRHHGRLPLIVGIDTPSGADEQGNVAA